MSIDKTLSTVYALFFGVVIYGCGLLIVAGVLGGIVYALLGAR